jgi:ATP synthase protein I
MNSTNENGKEEFSREVKTRELQKLEAINRTKRSPWSGLGLFGIIGWSIVVPTMLGAWFGSWLDSRYPGMVSWTLTCMIIGLVLGCLVAWHWISKEQDAMHNKQSNKTKSDDH